jgi:hypothetical protein
VERNTKVGEEKVVELGKEKAILKLGFAPKVRLTDTE